MLPWLLEELGVVATAGEHPLHSLTARTAAAAVAAFLLATLLGPTAIRWLKLRCRERIDSASARLNELHASKQNTPTMGGLFVVAAIVLATLVLGDLRTPYVQMSLVAAVGFGGLGALDDWIKLSTQRRGLTARSKLVVQLGLAGILAVWIAETQRELPEALLLRLPPSGLAIPLGVLAIPWTCLVITGSSNGVNLTDGLDGLASGCLVFAGSAFVALTYLAGHADLATYLSVPHVSGSGELSVVLGAMVGAVLGFLWFNCYPAQVFLGDTGSLPLGALLGLAASVTRQEVLLVIVGGVFVIETLSVILQVGCYRLFGRRLIACSPLHNHFVFQGLHEIKIVTRFWIGGALLAILGVASLKF